MVPLQVEGMEYVPWYLIPVPLQLEGMEYVHWYLIPAPLQVEDMEYVPWYLIPVPYTVGGYGICSLVLDTGTCYPTWVWSMFPGTWYLFPTGGGYGVCSLVLWLPLLLPDLPEGVALPPGLPLPPGLCTQALQGTVRGETIRVQYTVHTHLSTCQQRVLKTFFTAVFICNFLNQISIWN